MIALDFFQDAFAGIMVGLIDGILYCLVSAAYYIFTQVSKINLFGGSVAEAVDLFDGFTSRVYTILSIVMIFVLAYQIILMIINPDGKANKSTSLIKDILISLIFIAVCPTIFNYMAIFQDHVISDGTITNIVLGTTSSDQQNSGKNFSMVVLHSMYHPVGTGFSTFIDDEGKLKNEATAINDCEGPAKKELCENWYNALQSWSQPQGDISKITSNSEFRKVIGDSDGIEYFWIISTGVAAIVLYFLISYTIDLGTRAVKLGFLQLIAPIELILKVIPSMKKNYDKWINQLIKTYIDVFLKLFVISFIIQICILIPKFIDIVFNSTSNVSGGFAKAVAIVCLILGLLAFAKEAPTLLKELFGGNDLFGGIDFKPGIKKKLDNNTYAKKGLSMAARGIGGGIGNAARRAKNIKDDLSVPERIKDANGQWVENPDYIKGDLKRLGHGVAGGLGVLGGFLGGAIDGTISGAKNSQEHMSVTDTLEQFSKGAEYGSSEGKKRQEKAQEITDCANKGKAKQDRNIIENVTGSIVGFVGSRGDWQKMGKDFNTFKNAGHDIKTSWKDNVLTGTSTGTKESTDVLQTLSSMMKASEVKVDFDKDTMYQTLVDGSKDAIITVKNGGVYNGMDWSTVTQDVRDAEVERLTQQFKNDMKNYKMQKREEKYADGSAVMQQQLLAENIGKVISDNISKIGQQNVKAIEEKLGGQFKEILTRMSTETNASQMVKDADTLKEVTKLIDVMVQNQKNDMTAKGLNKSSSSADGGKK